MVGERMRILHVSPGIQRACGVSKFVLGIAKAQMKAGAEVAVVTPATWDCDVGEAPVRIEAAPWEKFAADFHPDAVHLHTLWNPYVHKMASWCRRHSVPYVVSPHGMLTKWALRYHWWKKLPAWWLYERRDLHRAAALHATAADEERNIRGCGLRQPVVLAPLGAESSAVAGGEVRHDIGFVGRIHPVKNLDGLLRAWAKVSRGGGWRLVIAGKDDVGWQAELIALSRQLGFKTAVGAAEAADGDAEVVFPGPVFAADKDRFFANSWATVLPSHSENFGGVVVESLAAGTPVIAAQGTPWKVLSESGCGWWVPEDRLAEALDAAIALTPELRREMSARSRQLIEEKFSWSAGAAALISAYRKLA